MARRPAVRLYGVWRQEWGYRRLGASVDRRASSPEQDELAEIDRHEHCLDCVFADLSWRPWQVPRGKIAPTKSNAQFSRGRNPGARFIARRTPTTPTSVSAAITGRAASRYLLLAVSVDDKATALLE